MKDEFRSELEHLINRTSMENGSDTPDFLLADFLCGQLELWDQIIMRREGWYGRLPKHDDALLAQREKKL